MHFEKVAQLVKIISPKKLLTVIILVSGQLRHIIMYKNFPFCSRMPEVNCWYTTLRTKFGMHTYLLERKHRIFLFNLHVKFEELASIYLIAGINYFLHCKFKCCCFRTCSWVWESKIDISARSITADMPQLGCRHREHHKLQY